MTSLKLHRTDEAGDRPGVSGETLARAGGGDAAAWREVVDAYTGRVYGLLLRQARDPDLAEELTQATFVKLVTHLGDGYEERGRFESWLFRVAMNLLRDEMRRRKRQASTMDMGPGSGGDDEPGAASWASAQMQIRSGGPAQAADPAQDADDREQLERLRGLVDQMGDADREVLHLRHTAGLSFPQIAEALDQPLGTVLARGHRAVKKLRRMMGEA